MTDESERNPGGQPPHAPTDEQRSMVKAFAIAGYTQDNIAAWIGIAPKTLRLHYRQELDTSAMKALGFTVGKLMQAIEKGEAWAICFFLKTKGKNLGFSERVEFTGKDGDPIMHRHTVLQDVKALIDAELGDETRTTKH